MTEYEKKERKMTKGRNKINNNIEIENVEKRFRFLYRTMENFNDKKSRNLSKNNNYSTVSNNITNKFKENNDLNNIMIERKNTYESLNKNMSSKNLYNKKFRDNSNNDYYGEKEESTTNINNIENSIENINIKLNPENYTFIKSILKSFQRHVNFFKLFL